MGIHALPFSTLKKTLKKPISVHYPENPITLGDHIRRQRIDRKLLQEDVAKAIGVSTDCITNWENNRNTPQIQFLPKIIEFLGYNPNHGDTSTFGEKVKRYRECNGLSHKKLGKLLGVDGSTIGSWENGESKPRPKIKTILERFLQNGKAI